MGLRLFGSLAQVMVFRLPQILAVLVLAAAGINWITVQTVLMARAAESRTRSSYGAPIRREPAIPAGDPPGPDGGVPFWRSAGRGGMAFIPSKNGSAAWSTVAGMPGPDDLRPSLVGSDWGIYKNSFFLPEPA